MVESEYITGVGLPPVNRRVNFAPSFNNEPVRPQTIEPYRQPISQNQPIRFTSNKISPAPIPPPYPQHQSRPLAEPQSVRPNILTSNNPQITFDSQRR